MYKTLIDAYALLGKRMWSVGGPGPTSRRRATPTMRLERFEAAVPQERLDDLCRRLEVSRWPEWPAGRAVVGGSGPGLPRAARSPLAPRV